MRELKNILKKFGDQYEFPYQYMHDNNRSASAQQEEAKEELLGATMPAIIRVVAKAFGGCLICYGKGYATVNDRWTGTDTDTDIGSAGGVVSGGNPNEMKYCTCPRGKQLKELVGAK